MIKTPYPLSSLQAMAQHPLLKKFWSHAPELLEIEAWPDCAFWQKTLEKQAAWLQLPAALCLTPEIKMGQRRKRKLTKQKSAEHLPTLRRYESSIVESHEIPMREMNLHDYFNALIWLQFPRAKYALHHCAYLSYQSGQRQIHGNLRNHLTDALTRFDEGGLVYFAEADENLPELREFFYGRDEEAKARFVLSHKKQFAIFGHGLLEVWCQGGRKLTAGLVVVGNEANIQPDDRLAQALRELPEGPSVLGTVLLDEILREEG